MNHGDLKSGRFMSAKIRVRLIKQDLSRSMVYYSTINCNLVFSSPSESVFLGYTLSRLFNVDSIHVCTSHLSQIEDFHHVFRKTRA